ncbi:MAG: DUF2203 domain-containing protein [Actinobacteria bacterium]|nr:DUF2203 domain-containing protein [Actinomycetota bacterium]
MGVRYWTVEEARAYLPRVRELLRLVSAAARPGPLPGTIVIEAGAEHAEAAMAEFEERGIILRQLGAGLIDFPSLDADGQERLLCWKFDEPDLAWWHRPEDGYAGRRPLEA